MRILILSDIHGNAAALDAIVAQESFDEVICLGDIVGYGPEPGPCLRWLRDHSALVVQGNHDRALGERVPPGCTPAFQWLADATYHIGEAQLTAAERGYLAELPRSVFVQRSDLRLMLVHATPRDPLYGYREPTVTAWADELSDVSADLVLVGHTHLQFELHLDARHLANPGSAGQPKGGDPRAAYAVFEAGTLRMGRVEYPIERTISGLTEAGVAPAAVTALGHLLRTGQVPTLPDQPASSPGSGESPAA